MSTLIFLVYILTSSTGTTTVTELVGSNYECRQKAESYSTREGISLAYCTRVEESPWRV